MNEIHIHLHINLPEIVGSKRMSCGKPNLSPAMVGEGGGPPIDDGWVCPTGVGTYTAKCTRNADGSCTKFMN